MSKKKRDSADSPTKLDTGLDLGLDMDEGAKKPHDEKPAQKSAEQTPDAPADKLETSVDDIEDDDALAEQDEDFESRDKSAVFTFCEQYKALYVKSCLNPDSSDIIDKHSSAVAVCVSVFAALLVTVCVLALLTVGLTPNTGITVKQFIESYNSVPASVSGTDAAYDVYSYLPDYEDVKLPEGAKLDGGKVVSLYDGHMEISAQLSGDKIRRLEVYGVDFPYFDSEQNGFYGIGSGDYSYLYYYIIMGKALSPVAEEAAIYDAYSAASYAYVHQYYAVTYQGYGMGPDYYSEIELNGKTVRVGYNLDKDCVYFEAVRQPLLQWPESLVNWFNGLFE